VYDFVGKLEEERPLPCPRHKWEDNIKKELHEIEWKDMDWVHLAHDSGQWWALVIMIMDLWVP
jgi:hypothetical protein